ncbi:MAG: hypothetical protein U5S82_13420 [Gammaproteobacteria bacterium]|nr:hypothetical protein [Gammaproteobacteria bacterium]
MRLNAIDVGIDGDDVRYHGCALNQCTGEALRFQSRATLKGLLSQLEKVSDYFGGIELNLCYEASYLGFSLQRDLCLRGDDCEVIAPTNRCEDWEERTPPATRQGIDVLAMRGRLDDPSAVFKCACLRIL